MWPSFRRATRHVFLSFSLPCFFVGNCLSGVLIGTPQMVSFASLDVEEELLLSEHRSWVEAVLLAIWKSGPLPDHERSKHKSVSRIRLLDIQ